MPDHIKPIMPGRFEDPYRDCPEEYSYSLQTRVPGNVKAFISGLHPMKGVFQIALNILIERLRESLVERGILDHTQHEQFIDFISNARLTVDPGPAPNINVAVSGSGVPNGLTPIGRAATSPASVGSGPAITRLTSANTDGTDRRRVEGEDNRVAGATDERRNTKKRHPKRRTGGSAKPETD